MAQVKREVAGGLVKGERVRGGRDAYRVLVCDLPPMPRRPSFNTNTASAGVPIEIFQQQWSHIFVRVVDKDKVGTRMAQVSRQMMLN